MARHRGNAALLAILAVAFFLNPAAASAATITTALDDVRPTTNGLQVAVRASGLPRGTELDAASVDVRLAGRVVRATVSGQSSRIDAGKARQVALVVDTSGSMAGERLDAAKQAGQSYLEVVPDDVQISVITFAQSPRVVVAPTTDRAAARAALSGMEAVGGTSLYDAVLTSLDTVASAEERRLVVLSDGEDSNSTHGLEAAVSAVARSGIGVDAVVLGQRSAAVDALTRITNAGSGRVFSAASGAQASEAFNAAAAAFDQRLVLEIPTPAGDSSGPVPLSVTMRTSDGDVLTVERQVLLPPRASGDLPGLSRAGLVAGLLVLFAGLACVLVQLVRGGDSQASDEQKTRAVLAAYSTQQRITPVPSAASSVLGDGALVRRVLGVMNAVAGRGAIGTQLLTRLESAGMRLTAGEWLVVHITISFGTVCALALLASPLLVMLVLPLAAAGPHVWLTRKASRRQAAFVEHMPASLQLISSGLASGYSLPQALDSVVREGQEPVSAEFGRALAEARLGVPVDVALQVVAERMKSDDFAWVVMAIRVQREVGGNLAEVLSTVCRTMRERASLRRQVAALSAEGRLSAMILVVLPILLAGYLALSSPDFFAPMYQTGFGIALLLGCAVALTVGGLWMKKLVKVEM